MERRHDSGTLGSRSKTIFDGALECDRPSRAEFTRGRCRNDEELQREVESPVVIRPGGRIPFHNLVMGEGVTATGGPCRRRPTSTARSEAAADSEDRYEMGPDLGRGGMSMVYLAREAN